jgi:hypothetical protein
VIAIAEKPRTATMTDLVSSVSTSVRPVIVRKTQKPLSFIHWPMSEPAPTAITR